MNRLSAVIIACNEAHNITRCLASLQGLPDEIIVVDSGSTDGTTEICTSAGCRVIQKTFTGYGEQKQFAVDAATNDWVLSIDADEEVTPALREEIRSLLSGDSVPFNGYYIPRDLVYLGRHMRFGGTSGERILRLFNRKYGRFDGARVHEKVEMQGETGRLEGKLLHFSYRDLANQFDKISRYATVSAGELAEKGKRYPGIWVGLKFTFTFITYYLIKGGLFDGYPGFMWALMRAVYASQKIARTIEIRKSRSH